jgi:hypothetical protein
MNAHLELEHASLELQSSTWRHQLLVAPMLGVRAWWSVTPDPDELARREGAQFTCLRRLDVVDVLLSLPIGGPVAASSLSAHEQRIVGRLPQRVVERAGRGVVRLACPPLRVDHVVVSAQRFRRGLEAASSFSTYCARSMVLSGRVEPSEMELTEAGYYGVGVYLVQGNRLIELVAPEPLPGWDETPASWVFSETLCDRLMPLT